MIFPIEALGPKSRCPRLHGRQNPHRDARTRKHANHEDSRTHHDTRRPDDQQFGPPQADKTGSFFTEIIIATALAVASPNNTMTSVVIFMRFPPHR
jgi:hypothetical protein